MDPIFFRKYIDILNEAVIDPPQEKLSDIFNEENKLYSEVREIIINTVNQIQQKFPEAKILDYFVVGAAVTFQYKDTSDIDTSLVYDKNIDRILFNNIFKYCRAIEKNVPLWKNKRPFQFTPQKWGRDAIRNADAAYDPRTDTWIKQPSINQVSSDYQKIIGDEESYERKMYAVAERSIQPSLQRLYQELVKNGFTDTAKDYINTVLKMYDSLYRWRNKEFKIDPGQKISQNWGTGNIIYKFFDAEHYGKIFSYLYDLQSKNFASDNLKNVTDTLINMLKNVINDEVGFVKEHLEKGKMTMDSRFFRKYIDILNESSLMEDPITKFASIAHEEWRKNYDPSGTKPRIKKNSDGTEGDINQPFDKIHPDWQKENLAAGNAALQAVKNFPNDEEAAAEHIHNEWMKRNPKGDWNAAQHVPYDQLSDDEKEKDRVHVRTMKRLIGEK